MVLVVRCMRVLWVRLAFGRVSDGGRYGEKEY